MFPRIVPHKITSSDLRLENFFFLFLFLWGWVDGGRWGRYYAPYACESTHIGNTFLIHISYIVHTYLGCNFTKQASWLRLQALIKSACYTTFWPRRCYQQQSIYFPLIDKPSRIIIIIITNGTYICLCSHRWSNKVYILYPVLFFLETIGPINKGEKSIKVVWILQIDMLIISLSHDICPLRVKHKTRVFIISCRFKWGLRDTVWIASQPNGRLLKYAV